MKASSRKLNSKLTESIISKLLVKKRKKSVMEKSRKNSEDLED